ncbi:hypothetical protein ANN_18787 [Periplaneta americana]|uniref:DUF4817 domain-containing protein n=1 Tax=Periplaneta americana TaxID=6978 RepID=A0ABQ8SR46_PERAM|nr:hypothetical protein ANN_18787 [Periplaneta americana]
MYSNQELAEIHFMYGKADGNAALARRLYQERYPQRQCSDRKTFVRLHYRLCDYGKFNSPGLGRGRPRSTTPEVQEEILEAVNMTPSISTRRVALQVNVPHTTVWRLLKEYQLYPYRLQRVQALSPADYPAQVRFCQWFLQQCGVNPNFPALVLFTDEAQFTRDGITNFHNQHVWAYENPRATVPSHHQVRFSLNMWAGIIGDRLVGPHVLVNRLTGQAYTSFLENTIPHVLEDTPLINRQHIHDGAPAHFSRTARRYLDRRFPDRWIGRGGPIAWPPRSPDLNPLDFYLWGHLKSLVYSSPVPDLESLRNRIVACSEDIRNTPGVWDRVRRSMRHRCEVCIQAGGGHFEHLLKGYLNSSHWNDPETKSNPHLVAAEVLDKVNHSTVAKIANDSLQLDTIQTLCSLDSSVSGSHDLREWLYSKMKTLLPYLGSHYSPRFKEAERSRPQSVEVAVSVDVHGSWTCNTHSCRMCGYSANALAFHEDDHFKLQLQRLYSAVFQSQQKLADIFCLELSSTDRLLLRVVYLSPHYYVQQEYRPEFALRDKRPEQALKVNTPNSIKEIDTLVRENRRITISGLSLLLNISHNSLHKITHKHLEYRKVYEQWVPRSLIDEQKVEDVKICQQNLRRHQEEGGQFLHRTVTVDEKVATYNDIVIQLFDKHAPLKKRRATHRPAPWLNASIRNLMTSRDAALRNPLEFRHPVGKIKLTAAFCYELQTSGKSRPQRIPTSFDVPTSDGSLPKHYLQIRTTSSQFTVLLSQSLEFTVSRTTDLQRQFTVFELGSLQLRSTALELRSLQLRSTALELRPSDADAVADAHSSRAPVHKTGLLALAFSLTG